MCRPFRWRGEHGEHISSIEVLIAPQTAGLFIAARLSENPDVQVLVLEAEGTNLDEKDLDVLRARLSVDRPIACQPHA
jgi:hypothetical protein